MNTLRMKKQSSAVLILGAFASQSAFGTGIIHETQKLVPSDGDEGTCMPISGAAWAVGIGIRTQLLEIPGSSGN